MTLRDRIKKPRWLGRAVVGILTFPMIALSRGPEPLPQSADLAIIESHTISLAGESLFDLSTDGRLIAAGGGGDSISVIDATAGNVIRTLSRQGPCNLKRLRLSPDGQLLAAECSSDIAIWNVQSGSLLQTLPKSMSSFQRYEFPVDIASLAFSPDNHWLAVGEAANTMAISIFDLSSGRVIQSWKAGPEGYGGVYSLTFAPDGKSLISSQGHEWAKEWDPGTGALLRVLPGNLPYWNSDQAAAFSPDGRWLALKGRDQCEIVDLTEGSSVRIVAKGLDGEPLGFTSDGRRLAILLDSEVGEGGKHKQDIALWDAESGEDIEVIPLGTYDDYALRKVLFSSRSNLVVHLQDKTNLSVGSLPQ